MLRVLQHHQAAPNLAARNRWMDSSMNERMVPTYLHVPICCFVLCCLPFWFSMLHMSVLCGGHSIFPLFPLPHFPHFPLLVFNGFFFCCFSCSHIFPIFPFWFSKSFFLSCYVSYCPRWFPNDQRFFNCVKASFSPLFLFPHFPHSSLLVFDVFFFCHFSCSHIFPIFPFWFSKSFFFVKLCF